MQNTVVAATWRRQPVDRLFDDLEPDDDSAFGFDPIPEHVDEGLSFDRYVAEGMALLEEWMRDPY